MRIDLAGRPIAITGASSGIGRATALACAAAGMPVALGARRIDKLEEVAHIISERGGRAIAVQVDVADAVACRRFLSAAARAFGGLYAVYANAGYGLELPVSEMNDRTLRDIFEVNFFGSMNILMPALDMLRSNPGPVRGHILMCSSCLAKMGTPYYAAYSATKAAQDHIGRGLRLELEHERAGIHVSTVHPIRTETELFDLVKQRSGRPVIDYSPQRKFQSADLVAAYTVACLRRPRPEVWTGLGGMMVRLGMAASVAFPQLGDFILRRMLNKRTAR